MKTRWRAGLLLILAVLPLQAQRGGGFRAPGYFGLPTPASYDGRFNFARLTYARYPGWSYDWPEMEENLAQILNSISSIRPRFDRNNIVRPDDPELFKFPVAYLSEPGYWYPTDEEA